MAGDPLNATLWPDADVRIAPLDAINPTNATDPWDSDWDLVGLLDGDAGFGNTREEEVNDLYAWGGILVRTSRRNFKLSITFTLLEDNPETRTLIWPGSTATKLYVPRPQRIKLGLELREGDHVKRLVCSDKGAEVSVDGDYTDSEADLTRYPMRAVIYPDPTDLSVETGAALLWHRFDSDDEGS